jgi:hypothetical protein
MVNRISSSATKDGEKLHWHWHPSRYLYSNLNSSESGQFHHLRCTQFGMEMLHVVFCSEASGPIHAISLFGAMSETCPRHVRDMAEIWQWSEIWEGYQMLWSSRVKSYLPLSLSVTDILSVRTIPLQEQTWDEKLYFSSCCYHITEKNSICYELAVEKHHQNNNKLKLPEKAKPGPS